MKIGNEPSKYVCICYTNPSIRGHSRLGPSTMAMLLGVILLTAWCSDKHARNWIRYLRHGEYLNVCFTKLMLTLYSTNKVFTRAYRRLL